jgi:DNA-binding transcriptional LysR family regulator
VELRHLRYFVAVAEELHFRRAADRLHVAPAAVSEQLRKLEAELGVLLVHRTPQTVSLTDAGAAMLVEARRVLHQADVAERVARQTHERARSRLRVGYTPDSVPEALRCALARSRSLTPGVEVVLEAGTAPGLVLDVREARLDAAAVCLPAATQGLRVTPIASESAVAAVPVMHPFADLAEIDLKQLTNGILFLIPRSVNPAFFNGIVAASRSAGLAPVVRESEEPHIEHLLMSVVLGHGIALLPASAAERYSLGGVRYVQLAESAAQCEFGFVTTPTPSAAVMQLVRSVRSPARPPAALALAA